MLDLLELKSATVTIDAMGCQKEIAAKIVAKKGHYMLAQKGNQGMLQDEVKAWLHKARREGFHGLTYQQDEQTDHGHGRTEVRRCTQVRMDPDWLTNGAQWVGLKSVVELQSERHIEGKVSHETRDYISSHEVDAAHAAKIIRGHWEIENKLHWVLDVTFKEDESRIRRGQGAEVMNALRKIALNLLKQNTTREASMKHKRKMAALDDTFRAELLLGDDLPWGQYAYGWC